MAELNMEAERAAFEAWHRSKFETKHSTGQPTRDMHNGIYAEKYGPQHQQQMWEAWQAARRIAPVSAPMGTNGEAISLPPQPEPERHNFGVFAFTDEQMQQHARQAIAPEEAAKTRSTVALLPDGEPVFINYGDQPEDNADLCCTACGGSGHIEDQPGRTEASIGEDPEFRKLLEYFVALAWTEDHKENRDAYLALIAYIDGRSAGTAPEPKPVREGWHKAEMAWSEYPEGTKARESWTGGGFWLKTARGWKWHLGATFPTPGGADEVLLAVAPTPTNSGREEAK